jgi:hypothetical protein
MAYSVYWIYHKSHSDVFSQGYVGVSKNPKFKGSIMATNTFTGKQIVLNGAKEIILAGFTTPNVYACVNGKAKNHKSHTFKRLEV